MKYKLIRCHYHINDYEEEGFNIEIIEESDDKEELIDIMLYKMKNVELEIEKCIFNQEELFISCNYLAGINCSGYCMDMYQILEEG